MLTEHDRPGLGARHRLGAGQELVAGRNEGGDLGAGVALAGTGNIGMDGAHLAGEGGPDRVGAGVGWHPEPSGGIHDLVDHGTPFAELALGDNVPAGPSLKFSYARCATFGPTRHLRQVGREQSAPKGGGAARR